jgi:hypothetical protein
MYKVFVSFIDDFCILLWVPYIIKELILKNNYDNIVVMGNQRAKGGFTLFGGANPSRRKKGGRCQ